MTPEGNVSGFIPEIWERMPADELSQVVKQLKKNNFDITPEVIGGFRLIKKLQPNNIAPIIIILANTESFIPQARIQKMSSWFSENAKIISGIGQSKAGAVTITDIEFLPLLPAILFESEEKISDRTFTSLSALIFLKKGYLNVIGYGETSSFSKYKGSIDTLIKSLNIPSSLQHPMRGKLSPMHTFLQTHWQQGLGFLIILSTYAVVFLKKTNPM